MEFQIIFSYYIHSCAALRVNVLSNIDFCCQLWGANESTVGPYYSSLQRLPYLTIFVIINLYANFKAVCE